MSDTRDVVSFSRTAAKTSITPGWEIVAYTSLNYIPSLATILVHSSELGKV